MRNMPLIVVVLILIPSTIASAQQGTGREGNDQNVEDTTREAAIPAPPSLFPADLELYRAKQKWKQELKDRTGVEFALESTTIYQIASGSRDANDAMENTTGLFGTWTIVANRNKLDAFGIGYQVETRGNFSGDTFQEMTADLGTLWSPNDATSDDYTKIGQLWVGQRINEKRFIYVIGKIDPGSFINANRFAGSGNTQFFSQPFATNPAKSFPDNGLGAMARISPVNWLHIHGVISDSDANSKHSPFTSIQGNWLCAAEVAIKPGYDKPGQGRYSVMV